jgi:hypothetical protein
MGCCMKKSIYGLKQAFRQWYLKFDETIRKFGFKENEEGNCVYAKFKNEKFVFLILYVDDDSLVVLLIYYWRRRSSCPQILI